MGWRGGPCCPLLGESGISHREARLWPLLQKRTCYTGSLSAPGVGLGSQPHPALALEEWDAARHRVFALPFRRHKQGPAGGALGTVAGPGADPAGSKCCMRGVRGVPGLPPAIRTTLGYDPAPSRVWRSRADAHPRSSASRGCDAPKDASLS
ncbi:hypothetical protein DR999_PMT10530 [Platysternon megacephalum]|uniref:Uncharacterized protein n=1 Tax=Platysternon megacephalum TaxID=55544 RepID=A0A4D9E897_9SAUR|nr:hypothetical protein DR999_PMT10530 [Platysternon megacephalum]